MAEKNAIHGYPEAMRFCNQATKPTKLFRIELRELLRDGILTVLAPSAQRDLP